MDLDLTPTNSKVNEKVVYFKISFRQLSLFTVLLPLIALVVCFTGAFIFQQSEIHETHCRVYNVIPSISAITGISPERYLWRSSIALHLGPRFLIASVYYNYYTKRIKSLTNYDDQIKCFKLVTVSYWLNIIEISALIGVTYISNQDNYPIHEKIFITFMTSSLVYMLISLMVFKRTHQSMTKSQQFSYNIKKGLFVTSIICTAGLVIFFMKHRFFCHDLAFSWFALCEYIIAAANMGYHVTVFLDFPQEYIMIASPSISTSEKSD
ncbi:post-GPI attachment to proteins factor 2-like [Cimex lectularius]|uniref:CWH43-like N-terminal domain-containing protein n=1 Tax=Cimex lectularius TaxID=79782 RepID=A0A8I6RGT4_CIMLE|nr:post-GPI attachment to proteins factor 2-like [Cimex lectularius]